MIEESGSRYLAKVKLNQETLFNEIDKISQTKEAADSYKAKGIQQSNEWIQREVFIYDNDCCFYHNGMTHIRSIIKTIKKVETTNYKTGEITNRTMIQFSIANFRESAKFFHDKNLQHWKVETMHQYKDNALLEDAHNAYLNPFLMTIIRSMILNILHLNGAKSIQEQLVNNRWDLDDSINQLLKFSF